MGALIDGVWHLDDNALTAANRPPTGVRNWITADGSPGPSGEGGFKAEAGRYHLYISRACPWAHRTAIFREIKGLQNLIGLSVTHWLLADNGWTFDWAPGVIADPVNGARHLRQLYVKSDPRYTGRVSVPVLWDKALGRMVSNESAEIIRMFNSASMG